MAEEFEEEEVWGAVKDRAQMSPGSRRDKSMIPRSNAKEGGNSTGKARGYQKKSAPMNIPEWPRDYAAAEDEEEEENENGEKVPPHEWVARKLARSRISSFSMCEGAGRTLKGRDLSRVRNAVLTRTGFLEN